ncbi:isochorismatase family protein [Brevibacterium samyangense]|uniref:Isochorismatase-like domain-containing protein n=1 Tax=Brevibacterium samyangense TaxID=366888 RepID=A0ABP5ER91_9MICO
MDALLVMNTETSRPATAEVTEQLGDIVMRARTTGGVLVFVSAPVKDAGPEDQPESVFVVDEEELGLVSPTSDAFDGIDDLAPGLHDLGVDRIVIGGVDAQWAVKDTAMAALALNFDVIVLRDATVTEQGPPVGWFTDAESHGCMVKDTKDTWLRM